MTTTTSNSCNICYQDNVTLQSSSSCVHAFCQTCWKQWLTTCEDKRHDPTCPSCRVTVPNEDSRKFLGRDFCPRSLTFASNDNSDVDNNNSVVEDELTAATLRALGAQRCPHCHVWIERIDGCDAMLCLCGQGFCWRCGAAAAAAASSSSSSSSSNDEEDNEEEDTYCEHCVNANYYDNVTDQEVYGRHLPVVATEQQMRDNLAAYLRERRQQQQQVNMNDDDDSQDEEEDEEDPFERWHDYTSLVQMTISGTRVDSTGYRGDYQYHHHHYNSGAAAENSVVSDCGQNTVSLSNEDDDADIFSWLEEIDWIDDVSEQRLLQQSSDLSPEPVALANHQDSRFENEQDAEVLFLGTRQYQPFGNHQGDDDDDDDDDVTYLGSRNTCVQGCNLFASTTAAFGADYNQQDQAAALSLKRLRQVETLHSPSTTEEVVQPLRKHLRTS